MARTNLISAGRTTTRRRYVVAVVVAILTAAPILVQRAVGGGGGPIGFDSLSKDEIAAAVNTVGSARIAGTSDRFEVLRVERHDEGQPAAATRSVRRADVSVYDYASDALRDYVVDVRDGSIDESTSGYGTQPPLSRGEEALARSIALSDRGTMAALGRAYRTATGVPLVDPAAQLVIVPIVFRADSLEPGRVTGASATCGRARCAQLLISSADDLLVDRSPIVDLSAGRVASGDAFSTTRP